MGGEIYLSGEAEKERGRNWGPVSGGQGGGNKIN